MKSEIEYFFLEDFKKKLELAKEIKEKGNAAIVELVAGDIHLKVLVPLKDRAPFVRDKGGACAFLDYFKKKHIVIFKGLDMLISDVNPSIISILEILTEEKEMRAIRDRISSSIDADTSLNPSFLERVIERHQYKRPE